jgi:hypothetical protein
VPRELKPFEDIAFSPSANVQAEFVGRGISKIGITLDGTASTGATFYVDAAARLLGLVEIVQGERAMINCEAEDLRLLSAVVSGVEPKDINVQASTRFDSILDLAALWPRGAINAAQEKVFFRGVTGAYSEYAATAPTDWAGTIRTMAETAAFDLSGGFIKPAIRQLRADLGTVDTDKQVRIPFDQAGMMPFIMLRIEDKSANDRVDGLLRRMKVDLETRRASASGEIIRMTYGQARMWLKDRAGWSREDLDRLTGVVVIPLIEPDGSSMVFERGDTVVLHLDNSSAVEGGYTAVGAAAGDRAIITLPIGVPVRGEGAQPGDVVRDVSASSLRALQLGGL